MIALGAGHWQMTNCQAPGGQVVASFLRSEAGIAGAVYILAPSGVFPCDETIRRSVVGRDGRDGRSSLSSEPSLAETLPRPRRLQHQERGGEEPACSCQTTPVPLPPDLDLWGLCYCFVRGDWPSAVQPPGLGLAGSVSRSPSREATVVLLVSMSRPSRSPRNTGRILKVREGLAQVLAGWNFSYCRQAFPRNAYGLEVACE